MSESKELYLLRRRPPSEKVVDVSFKYVAVTLASMVAVVLFAILIVVFWGSLESMGRYGLEFLVTSNWNPVDDEYGAFTAIYGTIVTSLLSLLIAVPLGVGTAVFITENIIPLRIRNVIGVMVELLAAIPSVVLGLWAIFVMEPFIRPFLEFLYATFKWLPIFSSPPIGPGTAPAILILVVMILPIITSISRDSLNQVPDKLRQAAYGVGTTRWGAILNVLLPAAISGIVGGVMLALGRAMGETMAVTMIIGNSNNFSPSLLAPGNTIAAMLANQFGEADGGQVSSLMYAAFILMILSLAVNVFAQWLVKRLSLKY
ncbi:MAG: phosphate ABC transporter permease subunit PstC [Synechococcus sp.]|uniref:phosphate ABC transporter permease subunit PstC n=1 Tax=Synechococcus sp. BMK-MC-1 TaxID=1442551 RepID=UPI0016455AE8|nr:phosphate ABC transporter permease subunit PstC [Synechococcus sp. BMK-MC-1]QNI67608.1 ABC-type phosphate transport system permease component [Synechococcus sp. BMK-MC-1]